MTGVYVNDDLSRLDLTRALSEVSPERRAVALRYRFDLDRRLSLAVYLLLKEALHRDYGLTGNPRLASDPNGKPFLPDHPSIFFSFSHCAKAAACAVSDRPVGVDVETVSPVDWDVAHRVLSAAECAAVRAAERPDRMFAELWTRKEALVKMRGEGLHEDRLPTLLDDVRDATLETKFFPERNYVLTGAWRDPD